MFSRLCYNLLLFLKEDITENVDATNLPPVEQKASGLAITTLIVGIASCTICCYMGFLTGILGIILGIVEKTKIDAGEHAEKGRTMNTWGIILSIVGIFVFIIFWIVSLIISANNPNMFR